MPPSASSKAGSNRKVANSLVAISSAAVLAVYAAGFVRTKAAAERFEEQSSDRRPRRAPAPAPQIVEARLETPATLPAPPPPAPSPSATEPTAEKTAKTAPRQQQTNPVKPQPAPDVSPEVAPTPAAVPVPPAQAAPAAPVQVAAAAPAAAPLTPGPPWKDGTWKGWGNCRHGDIQAAVVVENGKITSATIADCQTRYSCDVIDKLPMQVVRKQSADVDRVSSATQSSDAFYYAVYEALRQSNEAAKADTAAKPQAN